MSEARPRGWTGVPVLLLVLLLCARVAGAAPAPTIRLALDDCLHVDGAKVRRLFGIELEVQLQAAGQAAQAAQAAQTAALVSATCGEQLVALRVDDPLTGKSLARPLDLAAASERARPRLLALALAELLFASWTEREIGPPQRRADRRALRDRPAGNAGTSRIRLLGAASLLATFAGTGVLLGGGLRLGGDHRHHLGWSGDIAVHHGGAASPLGALTADLLTTSVGLTAQHRVPLRRGTLALRASAGLRLGATRLQGTPDDPAQARGDTLWGAFIGPQGQLSLGLSLPHHLAVELAVEGGQVLTPTGGRVAASRLIAIEGPFVGLMLGVGVER